MIRSIHSTSGLTAGGFLAAVFLALTPPARAALDASQVLILVNRDVPISGQVAQMYQKKRGIADGNILRLSMGSERYITPQQYWKSGEAVRRYLEEHPEIRCVLTTSGVPYTVGANDGTDEGAAFDNELAAVLRETPGDKKRRQPNPLYLNGLNPFGILDPRRASMVYVSRLDGPNLATITRMVDDAIAVENSGLYGPVAADAQGIDGVTGYGEGDATIRAVADRLGGAGFPVNLDMKMETWKRAANGPGNQAAGAAFYVGWYALLDFQDIFGERGLAQGSIAWHIASQEAQNIWDPGNGWCINLMRRGAAVTIGPVREPYVDAFPHGDVFVEALLNGLTTTESYWMSLPHISWAMVILGDPLYRPFGIHPRPSIVARGYVSTGANHVLVRGETSSLLVQLECVGVPGSFTPAFTAAVEPEMGLTAASGTVAIPAMGVGQTAIVRIPSVTAGDDPNGMFRLRLNARDRAESLRRIIVEGRIGFSRLTGGLGPKMHMFVSPDGSSVISGLPGKDALLQTESLQTQSLKMPEGFGLTDVQYAPDGTHLSVVLVDPQKKERATIIADGSFGSAQPLPPGTQFLRWLDKDRMLLVGEQGLVSHSVSGGEDRNLGRPIGKAGNIIAGTETQFSTTDEGQLLIQKPTEPVHEVLSGAKVSRFVAVANDLSLFGGVDVANQFWVQHGLDGQPEVIAKDVANVVWGPISRRALVIDSQHRARIYDGRDRSWKDLGIVVVAEWSADEESLLFVEGGPGSDKSLCLLTRQTIQKLCPMTRLGQVIKMSFSSDYKRAFLLASVAGQFDAWMMPLPPRVPAPPGGAK